MEEVEPALRDLFDPSAEIIMIQIRRNLCA